MKTPIKTTNMLPNPPTGGILAKIKHFLNQKEVPPYRYEQVVSSLQQGSTTFKDLHSVPKGLREELSEAFGPTPLPLELAEVRYSRQVEKVLFRTPTGAKIESVLSHYRAGWSSLCISSQSGCGLGCSFCATAAMGLMKNLTADEICAQVFHKHWQGRLPDSIAFMGMGEALANPNIFEAIKALTAPGYGGISQRRLTISTVGFAPNLARLLSQFSQVRITLSVHSPFSEERARLIPLEKRFPLKENLAILDQYVQRYNRKVYLAYLLIAGLNDSDEHASALAGLVHSQYRPELYHISVIPYNTAFGADPSFRQPSRDSVNYFVALLQNRGLGVTARSQFGSGIEAACGQLHADHVRRQKKNSL